MNVPSVGLFYALLSLDHMAVGPFLLSRPMVVGAVVGAASGNGPVGFTAGALVELIHIAVPPAGLAALDLSLVGGLAALWSARAEADRSAVILLAVGFAMLIGVLMKRVDRWARRQNDHFAEWISERLVEGRERVLWKALVLWAALWFMKSWMVFCALGTVGQSLLDGAVRLAPLRLLDGLDAGARFLPLAAFAAAVSYFWGRLKPAVEEKP